MLGKKNKKTERFSDGKIVKRAMAVANTFFKDEENSKDIITALSGVHLSAVN